MKYNPRPLVPVNPNGLDEIARSLLEDTITTNEEETKKLELKANMNPSDYIQIPGTNVVIAKYQSLNKSNWEESHFKLNENGLYMPTPNLMTRHLVNVINAAKGKSTLYDAQGNPILRDEVQELYQYLTKDGHGGGVWTWLDAKFVKVPSGAPGQLELCLETDYRTITKGRKKELQGKQSSLQSYKEEDCFVGLDFNSQGMPIKISPNQKYEQGDNIYFYHPRANCVARFWAGSDRADLSCVGGPAVSFARLGVLACAEGTQKTS